MHVYLSVVTTEDLEVQLSATRSAPVTAVPVATRVLPPRCGRYSIVVTSALTILLVGLAVGWYYLPVGNYNLPPGITPFDAMHSQTPLYSFLSNLLGLQLPHDFPTIFQMCASCHL